MRQVGEKLDGYLLLVSVAMSWSSVLTSSCYSRPQKRASQRTVLCGLECLSLKLLISPLSWPGTPLRALAPK